MKSKHMAVNENEKNVEIKKKNRKNKRPRITVIILISVLVVLIAIVLLAYIYINNKLGKLNIENITNDLSELGSDKANQDKNSQMSKYRNIAILGLDSRYDTYDPDYRTDCIMIASINKETNEVQLYSIYRDTYVEMQLDGETKLDKINHAYYNGVENTLRTINKNLDLNITEYVMADFPALVDLVDKVDGIDIEIDKEEIKYINDYIKDVTKVTGKSADSITSTGMKHLNGVQAMSYCRIRYTTGLDYKRTERMREVL